LGGDQQIGALIATGDVGLVIFFVDPLTAMPHDVDVKALMRLAIVYDIPMALNRATADTLLKALG
jgi:methylglyoxal synthase